MIDPREDAFEELLHRVARTPDVSGVRRNVGPGVRLAGRFEIVRQLGEGGMGRVYAARDGHRDALVALKMLGVLTPRAIVNIKREFRSAAELVHPNLVRLHELFCDGVEWFFTMDVVEGVTLPELLQTPGAPRLDVIRNVFAELAHALRALHEANTLHGDLKPSNFLVTENGRKVVLLDFGLARPLGCPTRAHFGGGTPDYVAPEQADGAPLTAAADWYSFGVVLHEALTGRLPSDAEAPPSSRAASASLRGLCEDLLRRDPAERPLGSEVLERIGSAQERARTSSMPVVPRGLLLGRSGELAALSAAYREARAGATAVVLVQGPSGIGKSALVEHFVREVRGTGAIVLSGKCRERESVGYKAIDGLIDDIVEWLDILPIREAKQLLPQDVADLTRVFPALRAAAAVAQRPLKAMETPDQGVAKLRAVAAFRDLLVHLAARAPLVVWIDDLQWSDAESAAFLAQPLRGPGRVPLLFIGSYRHSAAHASATLDALFAYADGTMPEARDLVLEPLPFDIAERLAFQLLPESHAGAARIAHNIARDAGGHPLFVAELASFAALSHRTTEEQGPATLAELMRARIAALPDEARGLLEATALAGAPLSRAVIRRTRGLNPAETERALDVLRSQRLARTDGLGELDALDVHHDRIRELIVQNISAEGRERHHLALAQALAAEADSKAEVLASHFQAAGALAQAGRYWIVAADQALASLAFDRAAALYELGESLVEQGPSELRRVRIRRAEALGHAGKGALAAEVYMAVAETCPRDEALELRRRAAEQLLVSGHMEKGLAAIEQVLHSLGMRPTRSGTAAFRSFLWGRLRMRARGLHYRPRSESSLSREELARVDASWTIACSLGVIDFVRGADFQNEHLLLALRAGEPRRLLRALTVEVAYSAASGRPAARTQRLLALADELAQAAPDSTSAGLLSVARGMAHWLEGRIEPALMQCREAVQILRSCASGAVWETVTAQRFVIGSLFYLGRFDELARVVPPLLAEAETQGNLYAATFFRTHFSNTAWLVHDRIDEARSLVDRARAEWTPHGFQVPHSWLLVGETHLGLYAGDGETALARVHEQWPKLELAQVLRIRALRVQLWQVRASAAAAVAAERQRRGRLHEARELRHEARHAARRVARQPVPLALPLAGLIDAALHQAEGNERAAHAALVSSIRGFDEQGMRLHAAAARARLGELAGARDDALVERSHAVFAAEGVVDPARMIGMLAPGFVAG